MENEVLIPFKMTELVRNLSPQKCRELEEEMSAELSPDYSVKVDPIGLVYIQAPLHISKVNIE